MHTFRKLSKNLAKALPAVLVATAAQAGNITKYQETGVLGSGYDSAAQEFKAVCVTGKVVYAGVSSGDTGIDYTRNSDRILGELGLKGGAELSLEIVTGKASSEFSVNAESNDLSIAANYRLELKGKTAKLTELKLTPAGKDAVKTANTEQIRQICGDSVITAVKLNASLMMTVNFTFSDSSFKSKFSSEAEAKLVDLLAVKGEVKAAIEKYGKNVRVSVVVTQIGGNVSSLANVFRGTSAPINESDKPDNRVRTHLFDCGIDNAQACTEALEGLIAYATNPQDGFKSQLNDMKYEPTQPNGPAFVEYIYTPYKETERTELRNEPNIVNEIVQAKRAALVEKFFAYQRDLGKAERLLNHTRMNESERQRLMAIEKTLNHNVKEVMAAVNICRYKIKDCARAYDAMALKTYPADQIKKSLDFWDYCNLPSKSKDEAATVLAIMNAAEVPANDRENCDAASEVIHSISALDLRGKGLVSVAPLAGMTQLTHLDLSNNQIVITKALSTLSNLQWLNMRRNKVSDMRFVEFLKKLTHLDAAQNKIFEPSQVTASPSIRTLRLYSNPFEGRTNSLNTQAPNSILTSQQLCSHLRAFMRDTRGMTAGTISQYRDMNVAPAFLDPEKPGDSQIDGWYLCPHAAADLMVEPSDWTKALPKE